MTAGGTLAAAVKQTNGGQSRPDGRTLTQSAAIFRSACYIWHGARPEMSPHQAAGGNGLQLELVNKLCRRRVSQYIQKGTAVACWIESDANLRPHAPTKRIDLG